MELAFFEHSVSQLGTLELSGGIANFHNTERVEHTLGIWEWRPEML